MEEGGEERKIWREEREKDVGKGRRERGMEGGREEMEELSREESCLHGMLMGRHSGKTLGGGSPRKLSRVLTCWIGYKPPSGSGFWAKCQARGNFSDCVLPGTLVILS